MKLYSKENTKYENDHPVTSGYIETTCVVCGDKIRSVYGRVTYCSQRCINDAYLERRKERKILERKKVCPVCNKHFVAKRKDSIYCSNACRQKRYRNVTVSSLAELSAT